MAPGERDAAFEAVAEALRAASAEGRPLRIRGGGTKLGWGSAGVRADAELSTAGLDELIEHNEGDLTAVLQAGVPLARAQERFAAAGQMLSLDPPAENGEALATIGGVIATADSGPLRHRYGGPRDLILGVTVALGDGTIASSGGKVIKNVAGYDLAKLFAGSFGTLGAILSVNLRLHPRPPASATALGASEDPATLGAAARALAAAPLELEALDVAWRRGRGGLLARVRGAPEAAGRRARRVAEVMAGAGLGQVDVADDDDEPLWARQRAGQRSRDGVLVRIATRPSALPAMIAAAEAAGGTLVGRAGLGQSYVDLEPEALGRLRERLPEGAPAVVLDGPAALRGNPWGPVPEPALGLMRRLKRHFDPAAVCNRALFVGGI